MLVGWLPGSGQPSTLTRVVASMEATMVSAEERGDAKPREGFGEREASDGMGGGRS